MNAVYYTKTPPVRAWQNCNKRNAVRNFFRRARRFGAAIAFLGAWETDKKGNHVVWVKAVYHTIDWQTYFANQIGSKTPVVMTKTKAMYDPIFSYVLLRQVICYDKAGKILFDSGDDYSGGWGLVNASDPVGLVGEYLCEKQESEG